MRPAGSSAARAASKIAAWTASPSQAAVGSASASDASAARCCASSASAASGSRSRLDREARAFRRVGIEPGRAPRRCARPGAPARGRSAASPSPPPGARRGPRRAPAAGARGGRTAAGRRALREHDPPRGPPGQHREDAARGRAAARRLTSRPALAAAIRSNSSKRRGWHRCRPGRTRVAWLGRGRRKSRRSCSGGSTSAISCAAGTTSPWSCSSSGRRCSGTRSRHAQWRLALEDLASDGVRRGPASHRRWPGPCRTARWSPRTAPLRRPLHVPGQLGRTAERRHAGPTTPQPVAHVTRSGRHSKATVSPSQSRARVVPDPATDRADDVHRQPAVGALDVAHAEVDLPDRSGPVRAPTRMYRSISPAAYSSLIQ